jgi:hypothetical protein
MAQYTTQSYKGSFKSPADLSYGTEAFKGKYASLVFPRISGCFMDCYERENIVQLDI